MANAEEVKQAAKSEVEFEDFRAAVEAEKQRIRNGRKSWFPWRIHISVFNINKEIDGGK